MLQFSVPGKLNFAVRDTGQRPKLIVVRHEVPPPHILVEIEDDYGDVIDMTVAPDYSPSSVSPRDSPGPRKRLQRIRLAGPRTWRLAGDIQVGRTAMATEMPKKGAIATILRQRTLEAMTKAGMTTGADSAGDAGGKGGDNAADPGAESGGESSRESGEGAGNGGEGGGDSGGGEGGSA